MQTTITKLYAQSERQKLFLIEIEERLKEVIAIYKKSTKTQRLNYINYTYETLQLVLQSIDNIKEANYFKTTRQKNIIQTQIYFAFDLYIRLKTLLQLRNAKKFELEVIKSRLLLLLQQAGLLILIENISKTDYIN